MTTHPERRTVKIGYARVSTGEQNPDLQIDALKRSRPQLDKCLKDLKPGDVLTVWKLDRLGRSLPHLVGVLEDLQGSLASGGTATHN